MEKLVVELCMGSSCFARGNAQTLAALETFLKEEGLGERVELVGHLCLGSCSKGPNLRIGETTYSGLDAACVIDLVRSALKDQGAMV
ncbi:MAG: (2Fe-2S) ferredoxin domain-containing protein [Sphaerochaeta sp.]|uniref:(2Fe-2S) ferredoxin domain-containing protein n=1 Tax=Sphaerochaeta sp. TaxID=1972642 RepID=UPI001DA9873A|nr:(2Fe-2S) ferredoxin domain-containing protein [uncultured Sphaerochaeta sp.]MDD3057123.1 (2Fe-2S) ferredoxin domain-containing protein [Sphaerochaeta sp.]MDD3928981.1 (2Fe-2S) ferredoxin domain-containing protein [Sphaerochaeta sp.]NCC12891.1 (2Fe-2S) ferredoxin domain-containing protein [Spirochaetia bacterium]NCC88863.1 (2Fe-2S) ferredoxin domain-containing protein [Spirochaetia bacterium]